MNTDDFRALARSSPYLWREVEFEYRDPNTAVRATVHLGVDGGEAYLHVADLNTGEVYADDGMPDRNYSWSLLTFGGDTNQAELDTAMAQHVADLNAALKLRPDGLVEVRPDDPGGPGEPPMWNNYRWVAILDPRELADGEPLEEDMPVHADTDHPATSRPPGVEISELADVTHHGRPALQARVRALPTYSPRCSCCPIIVNRYSEESMDWIRHDSHEYPDSYLVRLDRQTGICVYSEPQDFTPAEGVEGHDIRITAVVPR